MRIVYEGLRAGARPPRGITVQGGLLAGIYRFEPHGDAVDVPDGDAELVLALRPRHGRFRSPDGLVTPGGVQVVPGADVSPVVPPAELPVDLPAEPEADPPPADDPIGDGEPEDGDAADDEADEPETGVQLPFGGPDTPHRNGRRNRRQRGGWPPVDGGTGGRAG